MLTKQPTITKFCLQCGNAFYAQACMAEKRRCCSRTCARVYQYKDHARRFWKRVDISKECWEWKGKRKPAGYGVFLINKKEIYAHRYSYILHNGEIDSTLEILHVCDNPPCVNPSHLRHGSHFDNMQDAKMKRRMPRGSKNGQAKLTEADIPGIREKYAQGWLQKDIAAHYRVSPNVISKVLSGQSYQ